MKAQSALEYLIIISLLLAVLIPFVATSSKTWMLASSSNDVRDAVNTLAKAADFIYSSGGGRMMVTVRFPNSVQEFLVANRTIRIRTLMDGNIGDAVAMTAGPVAGALSQLAGLQTIPVWMSQAGTVIIGYVLQLTPTAISYTLVPGVTNITPMTVQNMLSQSVNGIGSSSTGISFLSMTQPSANLTAGANSTFNATFSPSAAQAPGTYTGSIKVNNSEFDVSTPVSVVIPLLLKMLGIVVCSDSECLNQTTQFYRNMQVWWRIYSKDQLSAAYDVTTLSSNLTNTSGAARYSASGQSTSDGMWNASYYFTSSDAAGSWNLSASAYDSYVTVTNSTLLSVGAACPDSKAPWWSGQNQSASSVAAGQNVTLSARWMDDCQLVASKLATNKTGSYSNESTIVTLSGTQQLSSIAFNTSALCGRNIGWKLWANDTSAKANETSVASFYVNFTASALKYANTSQINNGTNPSGSISSTHSDDETYYVIASQVSSVSVSNSTTLQPGSEGIDTYLLEGYDLNYGGYEFMRVGYASGDIRRGLIKFDISSIPANATIISAELQLYHYSETGSNDVSLNRITRSWTESGANWYQYDGSNWWSSYGGDYASPAIATASGFNVTGWKSWNITSLVVGWLNGTWSNYGVILINDSASTSYYFYSSDYGTAAYRPKLVINYTTPGGGSAVINITLGSEQSPENSGAVDFKLNMKLGNSTETYSDEFNDGSLSSKWSWYNQPSTWDEGMNSTGNLRMVSNQNTDFWSGDDSGHLLYQNITGDFVVTAKMNGTPYVVYQKAGIMARVNATDWLHVSKNMAGSGIVIKTAKNVQGSTSNVAGDASKPNSSWSNRKEINIKNVGSSDLINFPAYLNISKETAMQSDFDDLRFVSGACNSLGGSLLNYEIENYTASNAYVWVNIPSLNTGINSICMYYNNSGASSGQNKTGVWDSNFKGVWHLSENPAGTAPQMKDSTANGNNGTSAGSMTASDQVAARVDGGVDLDGTNDEITCGNAASLQITGDIAVEAWAKTSTNGAIQGIVNKEYFGTNNYYGYQLRKHSDNTYRFGIGNPTTAGQYVASDSAYTDSNWHYIVGVRASGTGYLYVDGVRQTGTMTRTITDSNNNFDIGRAYSDYAGYWFTGVVDEVRISNTSRSADWINQTYQMVANSQSVVTFGYEESNVDITYYYLKLERSENIFRTYYSSDGSSWTLHGTYTPSPVYPSTIKVGLTVASGASVTNYPVWIDWFRVTSQNMTANATVQVYNFNSSAWQSCWSGTLNSTESNATCSKGSDFINSTRNSLVMVSANSTSAFSLMLDYMEYNASYC